MVKISNYTYIIEFNDGDEKRMNKSALEASIYDIFSDVSKIIKRYRLENNSKKYFMMTLFTSDHVISASDYVEHYNAMPKEIWGQDFLDEFDIEIINMFN
jgi:hypothetical protein